MSAAKPQPNRNTPPKLGGVPFARFLSERRGGSFKGTTFFDRFALPGLRGLRPPSAPAAVASRHFLDGAATPPNLGGELARSKILPKKVYVLVSLWFLTYVTSVTAAAIDLRLVEAVRNQDQQQVRTLLNQRIDVNARA